MPRTSSGWERSARAVFAVAVVGCGLGALLVARGPGGLTTYAGHSDLAATLTLATGFCLVAAGVVTSLSRPLKSMGDLTMLAGLLWFAPVWVGWVGGPPRVRSFAMVAVAFIFPLLVHVALAYPDGRVRTALGRLIVGGLYAEAVLVSLGMALFRDPFFDPNCWANCTDNVLLLQSFPGLARALEATDLWFTVGASATFAALYVERLLTGSVPARRVLLPVAVPAILFAAVTAAHALQIASMPLEDPGDPVFGGLFIVGCAAVMLFAAGLVWGGVRTPVQRRAVSRIASSIGEAPAPGYVESALARAVGDPELRLAYWLPHSERYVDANGHTVAEPAVTPGRAITRLVSGDRPVALVSHTMGVPGIESEMGAAVRLALDNERLQAEGLAQLDELRASRTRIVEAGDAERQRLERDLHDGAQQLLLAASYDIRLARFSADAAHDTQTSLLMADALQTTQSALDELRELAQGIYPAILAEAGVAAALTTLADTAPLRLEVMKVTRERFPFSVETSAYLLVAEAVDDATARHATCVVVSAIRGSGGLVVAIEDDGSDRNAAPVRSTDRVGALGGLLDVGPRTMRAEIPCE